MSKPKTIDLTKLTPEERCRVMVDTVDSRYPTKNYKLNQPDVETTTTNSLIDQQAIVDFKRNNTELYPYKYGEIKIEPNVITYNGKIYIAIDSLNPTFEEVKKEWEEKGFEVENNDKSISFRNTKLNTDIYIDKVSKDIQICVCHYNYAQTISFDLHNLLTKTIRALEVENA